MRKQSFRAPRETSGRGFGAEDALEARAGELHSDYALASVLRIGDVDNAPVGGEVRVVGAGVGEAVDAAGARKTAGASGAGEAARAARGIMRKGYPDFDVRADGDIKARDERGAVAAKILAGSLFLEHNTAAIAAANHQGQANGDSTFRPLLR